MRKNLVREKFNWVSIIITLVFAFVLYYLCLPAFNLASIGFWFYIGIVLTFFTLCNLVTKFDSAGKVIGSLKLVGGLGIGIFTIFLLIILVNFILSPVFNSKRFSKRIDINEDGDFYKDVEKVDFSKVPLLDKESSQKLGDRVMGQMSELVSQFDVSDLYTQINYNNEIVRVTPLEYNGFFKYLSNHKKGVKGYITVNSVDGSAKLVKLDKGMKYMDSAILNEDLTRKLRFSYPTKIFGAKSFEIDNEGNPYWIVPTLKYVGIGLCEEVEGVVILNPITGKSKYYDVKDVPTWVDHVYSADLIIEQVDDWGAYKQGFLNSIFGQKNVTMTTEGYNYLVMNDDVYLYTGITSVATDESNLGFILTNMRTKETNFYSVPGAEEYSAMASAEGQVQQMKYVATFPLLINLNGHATYLISLKDNAGLVKMYSFVDVADYQKVAVTDASKGVEVAASNYLGNENIEVDENKLTTKEITISSISSAVINGNTYYYIVDTDNKKYMCSINTNKKLLPFLNSGSTIKVSYEKDTEVIELSKVK
ncbi:MAG TPA: YrzE family protein [Bacilli bacterium]|nr:YrzE family protein [Bacilli bacterium]